MDTELMAVLGLDVLQPARSMVQLALDHYKSDDIFQQLLSFDSAVEALDEIIDRLAEDLEDTRVIHTESSDYYGTQARKLEDIYHFAHMIEGLQTTVRQNFNQRARQLRGSKILRFPYDFPDELLLKIVNRFESTFDENIFRFDSEHPVNIRSIQSLRLTCRRLCEISSPFLVPYIYVTPRKSSFGKKPPALDAYQGFGKAVFGVRDIFKSLMPYPYQETRHGEYTSYQYDSDAFDIGVFDEFPDQFDEIKDSLNKSQRSVLEILQREHARYQELYEEQNTILRSDQLTRTVAAAAARSGSNIFLHISDRHIDPIHGDPFGLRPALREHGGRDVDHDFVIRLCGRREAQEWELDDLSQAPQSVLYELPLAISAAGANLTQLVINTSAIAPDSGPALNMTQDQRSALERACRSLKTLVFEVFDSEEKKSLLGYLSAVVGSQMITDLSLDLGCINTFSAGTVRPPELLPPSSPHAIGPLQILEPWDKLKTLYLKRYSVHLNELAQLLIVLKPGVRIALHQITLLSGTWAEALDRLRMTSGVGWGSNIAGAHGSEVDDMSYLLYELMFGHSAGNSINWATRFICSGEGARNPLHHTAELSEALEKVPKGRQQSDWEFSIYTAFQQQSLQEVQID